MLEKIIGYAFFKNIGIVLYESNDKSELICRIDRVGGINFTHESIVKIAEFGALFPTEEAKSIIKREGELNTNYYKGNLTL
jgi:hypothetical protein